MRRGGYVGVILLLLVGVFALPLQAQDRPLEEQADTSAEERGFRIEQEHQNLLDPDAGIPFILDEELFLDGRPVVVSLRIFNVLQQLVAVPVAVNAVEGEPVPLEGLQYTTPGRKEAFWDGLDQAGRRVSSGVYFLQFIVNGHSYIRKLIIGR